jgi:hypothetical protein
MESAEARINRRAQAVQQAEDRAHRIAHLAAESMVRFEGVRTGPDEYLLACGQADPHLRDCVDHLVWHGRAVSHAREHGHLAVQLGDFTIGGGT